MYNINQMYNIIILCRLNTVYCKYHLYLAGNPKILTTCSHVNVYQQVFTERHICKLSQLLVHAGQNPLKLIISSDKNWDLIIHMIPAAYALHETFITTVLTYKEL